MKLRCHNIALFKGDADGDVLVGKAEHLDLKIEVNTASGHCVVSYPFPSPVPVSSVSVSIDLPARIAQVLYRDSRWESLRRQLKHKRRSGWKTAAHG